MFIQHELCLGCGLCIQACPRQAISISGKTADIDTRKCNDCGTCLTVCPHGAISPAVSARKSDMRTEIASLKIQTDDIIARIEKMKNNAGSRRPPGR
jgi:ferredoxin